MATTRITRALFSASWTTSFRSLLTWGKGTLMTRAGYSSAKEKGLRYPWELEVAAGGWDWFWARYLGGSKNLRTATIDRAWEYLVPLGVSTPVAVNGPERTSTEAAVLLYPASVAVVFHVEATEGWAVGKLASGLQDLRRGKHWSLGAGTSSPGRKLDGIAAEVLGGAVSELVNADPGPGVEALFTVAAPASGSGSLASLDLSNRTVKACISGLASMGPPAEMDKGGLLDANRDTDGLGARIYVGRQGHVIWHPQYIQKPPPKDPIRCLVRNHTSLAVHVAALSAIASWASERVTNGKPIPADARKLARLAVGRLERLSVGDRTVTYSSGVAQRRIAPLEPAFPAIKAVVGPL